MGYFNKKTFIAFLLCFLITGFSAIAFAQEGREGRGEGLSWETTDVHFRGHNLVVEGYFRNNSDREIIDRVDEFYVKVKLKRHGDWLQHSSARYDDIRVFIRPGETHPYRFIIEGVEPHHIEDYRVWTTGSYHFHNHHGMERHRHDFD